MYKKYWAGLLFFGAFLSWFFPDWNGLLFAPSPEVGLGEGRIVAAILFVGGLILWYLPSER